MAVTHRAMQRIGAVAYAVLIAGCVEPDGCDYDPADEAAVRDAVQNYVSAWLENDADKVMATLTDDIVLQPHHGDPPIVGAADARAWWFPDGPPTEITRFSMTTEGTQGCGTLAYAWGRFDIEWTYEGLRYSNAGNALSIVEQTADGWRISHQIWNDPVNRVVDDA